MTTSDYWRKLEAEGRLRDAVCTYNSPPDGLDPMIGVQMYMTLRLTDEEREKLLWDPAHLALTEPEDGADCGIAEFTNLDILGGK